MIQCVFDRLLQLRRCVNNINIATSLLSEDDLIAEHSISQGVKSISRQVSEDPLDRYLQMRQNIIGLSMLCDRWLIVRSLIQISLTNSPKSISQARMTFVI